MTNGCCGQNGRILLSVATHEKIGKVFSHAASYIKAKIDDETKRCNNRRFVRHAFRCKNGQHRSVAVAEATATALRDLGFEVVVQHLAYRPCGCPENCGQLDRLSKQQASERRGNWAADGHAAHVLASRLFKAVW